MTTALFLLRCVEIGISIRDLDLLTIGLVLDMWCERARDKEDWGTMEVAGQSQFDAF